MHLGSSNPLIGLTALLIVLMAAPKIVGAEDKRLAVLTIQSEDLPAKARSFLTDELRGVALKHMPAGWVLMDKGNMLVLLDAMQGQSCEEEAECDVEAFRKIGAAWGVSGEVVKLGSKLRMSVRLYDSETGALLKQASSAAKDIDGLLEQLPATGASLFEGQTTPGQAAQLPPVVLRAGPSFSSAKVTEALGRLRVEGSPRGARVEVSGAGGFLQVVRLPHTLEGLHPGGYSVRAEAAGFVAAIVRAAVEPDLTATVQLKLQRPGGIHITGTPVGAQVELSTSDGAAVAKGGLPMQGAGLAPGRYRLQVSRQGYQSSVQEVTVSEAQTTEVAVQLRRGEEAGSEANKAVRVAQEACRQRKSQGCMQLAGFYLRGQGVRRNLKHARRFYSKACQLGSAASCVLARKLAR